MAYLTIPELYSHLYQETVDEITRGDDTKAQEAIDAAIEEARGYLSGYDTDAVFNATDNDRNPVLLLYVKDIAVWHLINVANPGIDYQSKMDRYEKATHWLGKVQSGKVNPNLPLPEAPTNEYGNVENFMKWGSNTKRSNYY
jgi:phage gp36-like protein